MSFSRFLHVFSSVSTISMYTCDLVVKKWKSPLVMFFFSLVLSCLHFSEEEEEEEEGTIAWTGGRGEVGG